MEPAQIREIGKAQRLLLWAVLASILQWFFVYSILVLLPFQLYCVWNLGKALGLGMGMRVVYLLLMFIPLVSLITLLVLNSKATNALQEAGIRVGLMGASPSDLPSPE